MKYNEINAQLWDLFVNGNQSVLDDYPQLKNGFKDWKIQHKVMYSYRYTTSVLGLSNSWKHNYEDLRVEHSQFKIVGDDGVVTDPHGYIKYVMNRIKIQDTIKQECADGKHINECTKKGEDYEGWWYVSYTVWVDGFIFIK
jgi:hypothetical protein